MDAPIANRREMKASQVLGRFAECQRRLEEAGLSFVDWQAPIDDADFRNRLVQFWKSRGEPVTGDKPIYPIWFILKLGTGLKTANDFRKALGENQISDVANNMLNQPAFTASDAERWLHLVVISVAQLGFPTGATRQEIYDKAKEFCFQLCPPEAGPQLLLQYNSQPNGEWLIIGMEPISDSAGVPRVFGVARKNDGARLLHDRSGTPDYFHPSGDRWVFVR